MIGELTDDSAGLTCTPSTESTAGSDPFAHLPQFWCLEVAAEKKADGSHEIFYVEHIDDTAKVRGGEHLCWVLQKNTYKREWQDKDYKYNTNLQAIINKKGIVKETIYPNKVGIVIIEGESWSAISYDNEEIDKEEMVEVLKIEGVKVVVKKID